MATTTDPIEFPMNSNQATGEDFDRNQGTFFDENLLRQTNAMYKFATESGLGVPAILLKKRTVLATRAEFGLSEPELEELASIHQQLTRIVAPATPQTLLLLESERERGAFLSSMALIPIVRHIILASVFFLILFVVIGQLKIVTESNLQLGILGSDGLVAVAILTYLASCAGLGACFTSLYTLKEYISDVNFDPRYNSTYWASILLGVIAGLFISELLYATLFGQGAPLLAGESGPDQSASTTVSRNAIASLGKPALALLGGFSASMVYKILQRIVDSIESIFRGDQRTALKARRAAELAELKLREDAVEMKVANQLVALTDLMESEPDKARIELKAAIKDLLKK